jgi:hypothetical protein
MAARIRIASHLPPRIVAMVFNSQEVSDKAIQLGGHVTMWSDSDFWRECSLDQPLLRPGNRMVHSGVDSSFQGIFSFDAHEPFGLLEKRILMQ